MGYEALIVVELSKATKQQEEIFYNYLKNCGFKKIKTLNTAWSKSFPNATEYDRIFGELGTVLTEAKNASSIFYVDYAYQISTFKPHVVIAHFLKVQT